MKKEKFVLVSTTDASMKIDNATFDKLEDAQEVMRKEWVAQNPDERYDDYINEMEALVNNGAYVFIWKIIAVSF